MSTHPAHWRRRSARTALLAAAAVSMLAACSSTGASSAPSGVPTAAPSGPASASAAPASVAPSTPVVASPSAAASVPAATVQDLAVTGTEYAFELPASVPAGVTKVTLTNAGKEEHQAQVAKLADGKTLTDLTAALAQNEAAGLGLLTLAGGPTGVQPGEARSTTANLAPGSYVFLCFVQTADGVPHLAKGMIAPLEVTEPAVTAAVPAGDAAVTLQDFAFVGLDTLTTGPHTVTVTNSGPQPHEATIVKLADGVTAADLLPMFTSSAAPSGPPPFTTAGGVAGVAVGETITMDVDLPAGDYAFVCFVPDANTGAPHAALGMIAPLTIQ